MLRVNKKVISRVDKLRRDSVCDDHVTNFEWPQILLYVRLQDEVIIQFFNSQMTKNFKIGHFISV